MGMLTKGTHGLVCPILTVPPQVITSTGDLEADLQESGRLEALLQSRSELDAVVPAIACAPDPAAFAIDGTSGPASPVEIGTIVANPTMGMSYINGPPTAASVSDVVNGATPFVSPFLSVIHPFSFQELLPGSILFTFDATKGAENDQDTRTLQFLSRHFIFWSTNAGPLVEADVLAGNQLTSALTSNAAFSVTINPTDPPNGAYLYHVFIDSLGPRAPTKYILGTSGIPGGMSEIQAGLVMGIPNGNNMTCRVMRSNLRQEAPGGMPFQGLA